MAELKTKVDKYKDIHFPKEKPFKDKPEAKKPVPEIPIEIPKFNPNLFKIPKEKPKPIVRALLLNTIQSIGTQFLDQMFITEEKEVGLLMNKYEIKYMLESEQSKTDRLIDIMGRRIDTILMIFIARSRSTNKP